MQDFVRDDLFRWTMESDCGQFRVFIYDFYFCFYFFLLNQLAQKLAYVDYSTLVYFLRASTVPEITAGSVFGQIQLTRSQSFLDQPHEGKTKTTQRCCSRKSRIDRGGRGFLILRMKFPSQTSSYFLLDFELYTNVTFVYRGFRVLGSMSHRSIALLTLHCNVNMGSNSTSILIPMCVNAKLNILWILSFYTNSA